MSAKVRVPPYRTHHTKITFFNVFHCAYCSQFTTKISERIDIFVLFVLNSSLAGKISSFVWLMWILSPTLMHGCWVHSSSQTYYWKCPNKTTLLLFTWKRKIDELTSITLKGVNLQHSDEVKYFGMTLDNVEDKTTKALNAFWLCIRYSVKHGD